jgi:hypothetical protein
LFSFTCSYFAFDKTIPTSSVSVQKLLFIYFHLHVQHRAEWIKNNRGSKEKSAEKERMKDWGQDQPSLHQLGARPVDAFKNKYIYPKCFQKGHSPKT